MPSDYDVAFPPLGSAPLTVDPPGPAYSPSRLAPPLSVDPDTLSLPPLTPSETSSVIVGYDPRFHSVEPAGTPIFPAHFEPAINLLRRGGPVVAADDALLSSKEARAVASMTPYAPTPTASDTAGALAVLHATPYVPTPPQFSDFTGALAVLNATPYASTPTGSSVHDSQLLTPGLGMSSQPTELYAWIERTKQEFLGNPNLQRDATREIVLWVASTFSLSPSVTSGWDLPWMSAIRDVLARGPFDFDAVTKAATAFGYSLVRKDDDGEPTPKRSRTAVPAESGRKRTRSGSLPPFDMRTPRPSPSPCLAPEMNVDPAFDPAIDPSHVHTDETPLPGLEASMHAPGRVTPPIETVPTQSADTTPTDPVLQAILSGLNGLTATVSSFGERLASIESRVTAVESGKRTSPSPPTPVPMGDKGKGRMTMPANLVSVQTDPAPIVAPVIAQPPPLPPRETRPANGSPSYASAATGRPRAGVVPPVQGWTVVGKKDRRVQPQRSSPNLTGAPSRTSSTSEVKVSKFTVIRDGGLQDREAERLVCAQAPSQICLAARTAIERLSAHSPPLLSGQWARRPVAGRRPAPTGNFTYTFSGEYSLSQILPFADALIGPLRIGRLVPGDRWTWAQIRNVPTRCMDGSLRNNDELTAEVQRNPLLGAVPLCIQAHWHGSIDNVRQKSHATVVIAYVDRDGSLSRDIGRMGVHMYGARVPFVVLGDRPTFVQCGRCHMLDHSTENCRLRAGTLRCYICGGGHDGDQHARSCPGSHAVAGRCECRFKCLLCNKTGHHARSHKCPRRGRFPSVPLVTSGESAPPADPPAPPARVDDLVPTQRTSLTIAALPVRDLREITVSKRKGKKSHQAPTMKERVEASGSSNQFSTLTPIDLQAVNFDIPDKPPPETGLTSWDDCVEIADEDMAPPPRFLIFTPTDLPSVDAVRAYYLSKPLHNLTVEEVLDEAEIGWGGRHGQVKECVSLLARFALLKGFPMTRAECRLRVVRDLTAPDSPERLRKADLDRGGDGMGSCLNPVFEITEVLGRDTLLLENRIPPTNDQIVTTLKHYKGADLCRVVEDFDLQTDGDGDGSALASLIHGQDWETVPGLFERVRSTWSVPSDSSSADVARRIARAWDEGMGSAPALIHFYKLVSSYLRDSGCGTTHFTDSIVSTIAAAHSPYDVVTNGVPWYRDTSPAIVAALYRASHPTSLSLSL